MFEKLNQIILEEGLNKDETYKLVSISMHSGKINSVELHKSIPHISNFSQDGFRQKKHERVLNRLTDWAKDC